MELKVYTFKEPTHFQCCTIFTTDNGMLYCTSLLWSLFKLSLLYLNLLTLHNAIANMLVCRVNFIKTNIRFKYLQIEE